MAKINDENLLISIIIPVYNAEKYIEQCLNSIKNQTYNYFEELCSNSLRIISAFGLDVNFKFSPAVNFCILHNAPHPSERLRPFVQAVIGESPCG